MAEDKHLLIRNFLLAILACGVGGAGNCGGSSGGGTSNPGSPTAGAPQSAKFCGTKFTSFFSESTEYQQSTCAQGLTDLGPAGSGLVTAFYLDNIPFNYVTDKGGMTAQTFAAGQPPNASFLAQPGFFRDSSLPFGQDEQGADQANLVYFGGHGRSVRDLIDKSTPEPLNYAQVFEFARSYPLVAPATCKIEFSTSADPLVVGGSGQTTSAGALGQGPYRGDATMLILHSSCQMHDRALFGMMKWSRIGQAFGWEGSPKLNDTSWLYNTLYLDTQSSVSNSQAWIQRGLDFTKVNGDQFRTAGPSVLVASPLVANGNTVAGPSPDLVMREASVRRQCHTQHSARKTVEPPSGTAGSAPAVVVDPNAHFDFRLRKLSACLDNNPTLCSAPAQCDTARAQFSNNRVLSPLLGSPVTRPTSVATNQPAGTQVLNITFSPPALTDDEIAQKAAFVAESMTGLTHDPIHFKFAKQLNANAQDWSWQDVSDQIAYGYHPRTFRARWTINEWLSDPLDVGWDQAALIAEGYLSAMPPEVAPSIAHVTATEPLTAELFESSSAVNPSDGISKYIPYGYLFSVFRKVNGVPVLNMENIIVVHRSGRVWYLSASAASLGLQGAVGAEKPVLGSYFSTRRWTASQIVERFTRDSRDYAGEQANIELNFSGVYYARNPTKQQYLNQYYVFQFIPKYPSGVVGNTELWGYQVDSEQLTKTDLSRGDSQ